MNRKTAADGFIFGSFMQLAVGPLTFIALNISIQHGYMKSLAFSGGEILIDIFYMFLASVGVSGLLQKNKLQVFMKAIGSLILFVFGINMIISVFGISLFPKISVPPAKLPAVQDYLITNYFFQGIILTASNPLSIIFFSGIFTSKVVEKKYTRTDTFLFAIGCVTARICFLVIIIFLGSIIHNFLNLQVLNVLNIIVGIIIIYFGVRLLLKIWK